MSELRLASESDLYAPVKAFLEACGYRVRGEVGHCDIVAVRDYQMIAVELKLAFGLPVIYQALDRMAAADLVYVAVAVPPGKRARANWDAQRRDAVRLCRLIGLGLLSVRDSKVEVHADPAPYRPRKQPKQRARLLGEFARRSGDHNTGGTTRRPRMTAYREDALACAAVLAANGEMKGAAVRDATSVTKATAMMRSNVYGWFEKTAPGTYFITDLGRAALLRYADVLAARAVSAPEGTEQGRTSASPDPPLP